MPRVGTATTSGANGSGSGSAEQRAKRLDQAVGPLSSMDVEHCSRVFPTTLLDWPLPGGACERSRLLTSPTTWPDRQPTGAPS